MANDGVLIALAAVRLTAPVLLLAVLGTVFPLKPTPPAFEIEGITPVVVATARPRRAWIVALLSLAALTYLLDFILLIVLAIVNGVFQGTTREWFGVEAADVVGLIAFSGLAIVGTWKHTNGVALWTRKRVKFFDIVAIVFDIAQLVLLLIGIKIFPRPDLPQYPGGTNGLNVPHFLHFLTIAIRILILVVLLPILSRPRMEYDAFAREPTPQPSPTPATYLLPSASYLPIAGHSNHNGGANPYGTFPPSAQVSRPHTPTPSISHPSGSHAPPPLKPNPRKEVNLEPSWGEIWARLRKLTPYLWPSKSRKLQGLAFICVVILLAGRAVNLMIPLSLREVVSRLEHPGSGSVWLPLFIYTGLRFLQSSGGLPALRDILWAPVMQYSDRQMSQLSFDHLLNLSLAFHTRRKTGEILRILDRGAAINHIFEMLLFNIGPTFLDIIIALASFYYFFGPILAGVIFVVMVAYVTASVILTQWRTKLRRQMNDRDVITRGIHTDCLLNYETVKYFGGEEHEGQRYREAIREYQTLEFKVMASLNLLNLVQNFIITLGLLAGSIIVARGVLYEDLEAADFVLFITYLAQLYGPLTQLGYIYRQINQSLVDTERLLNLLNEPSEVNDKPGAPDLNVFDGEIVFDNVTFSYDDRSTALHGVSFTVPKGCSVALVGESGSGKSTILRLLYRFYDLKEGDGRILIDGQDIREVTQSSLRKAIGVVPQDSVLFNATVAYNIGYGKFGATEEEIEAAAKAAQMHERIQSFPDGYETKVGERGVRLSGGEKQRVAIARTLLKDPSIIALDEATSALDTTTERDIQKALQELVRGRSSLSIAHRLSTIVSSDIIIVLKDGQIAESGSHRELLAKNGIFAAMWAEQISSDDEGGIGRSSPQQSVKEVPEGYLVDVVEPQAPAAKTMDEVEEDTNVAAEQPDPSVQHHILDEPSEDPIAVTDEVITDTPKEEIPVEEQPEPVEPPQEQPQPEEQPETEEPKSYAAVAETGEPAVDAPIVPAPDVPPPSDPISFPSSAAAQHAPVGFPGSPEEASPRPSISHQGSGVTFQPGAVESHSRSGTPDPEDPSKTQRKRVASQNIARMARKFSLGLKRTPSSSEKASSPLSGSGTPPKGTGSGASTPRISREDPSRPSREDSGSYREGSVTGESPAASIIGEEGKPKKKKLLRF